MKRLLFTTIVAIAAQYSYAQNIAGVHRLRGGDEVHRLAASYIEADDGAQDILWDFSGLVVYDDDQSTNYTEDVCKERLVGTERGSIFHYEQGHDSLMLWGYENRLTKVEYDRPELLLRTPLTYGALHTGMLHGTMTYCERLFMRICGSYTVEIDATGTMLLPSGDTLRHVSRVHLTEYCVTRHYPQVTTEKQLRAYLDSIPYTADSISKEMRQLPQQQTDIYRWYAEGYRYPILETVATGPRGGKLLTTAAYYCSPEEQQNICDHENEQVRQQLAIEDLLGSGSNTDKSTSPLSLHDVMVKGSTVTVSYDLTQDATVSAIICSSQGMVYLRQSQSSTVGTGHQLILNCSALRSGEYILYLNVNGHVQSTKVNL